MRLRKKRIVKRSKNIRQIEKARKESLSQSGSLIPKAQKRKMTRRNTIKRSQRKNYRQESMTVLLMMLSIEDLSDLDLSLYVSVAMEDYLKTMLRNFPKS